ncbi:ran GTPase binding protein Hba1 [Schizosaccharomyces octosporus yFS286]|uniref:Ran GTPase binding protein Hba1 n=1 Tax=Schizosaccharomyces octosporus (strain yFS286) TaxID=483514 RepID=S9QVZ2_SCHOY|nr:ran GTPase binding protein Hba1 [Schizosaccharomyces octosporus yFS286]EPX70490.1 ran GTPase binding protein Hba1 [Schizosaccharomyces octosporus yFS286]
MAVKESFEEEKNKQLEEKTNEASKPEDNMATKRKHESNEEPEEIPEKKPKDENTDEKNEADTKDTNEGIKATDLKKKQEESPDKETSEQTEKKAVDETSPPKSEGTTTSEEKKPENENKAEIDPSSKASPKPFSFSKFASFSSSSSSPFASITASQAPEKKEEASPSKAPAFGEKYANLSMNDILANTKQTNKDEAADEKKKDQKQEKKSFEELLANETPSDTAATPEATEDVSSASKAETEGSSERNAVQINQLSENEIITGEEKEKTLYSVRARLYVVDGEKKIWKERGHGVLKVNVPIEGSEGAHRLVMRNDAVHRVIMNVPLFQGMSEKAFQIASASSGGSANYVKIFVIENGNSVLYAVHVKDNESASQLRDHILAAIPKQGKKD